MRLIRSFAFFIVLSGSVFAADYPAPNEGDFIARDFKFTSGESLPELRLYYRSLGKPVKDAKGPNDERRSHHPRHDRQRRVIHPAGVCR